MKFGRIVTRSSPCVSAVFHASLSADTYNKSGLLCLVIIAQLIVKILTGMTWSQVILLLQLLRGFEIAQLRQATKPVLKAVTLVLKQTH